MKIFYVPPTSRGIMPCQDFLHGHTNMESRNHRSRPMFIGGLAWPTGRYGHVRLVYPNRIRGCGALALVKFNL
jgi:hypothetical protein